MLASTIRSQEQEPIKRRPALGLPLWNYRANKSVAYLVGFLSLGNLCALVCIHIARYAYYLDSRQHGYPYLGTIPDWERFTLFFTTSHFEAMWTTVLPPIMGLAAAYLFVTKVDRYQGIKRDALTGMLFGFVPPLFLVSYNLLRNFNRIHDGVALWAMVFLPYWCIGAPAVIIGSCLGALVGCRSRSKGPIDAK